MEVTIQNHFIYFGIGKAMPTITNLKWTMLNRSCHNFIVLTFNFEKEISSSIAFSITILNFTMNIILFLIIISDIK